MKNLEMMIPEPKYRAIAELEGGKKWVYGYFCRVLGSSYICQGEPVDGNLVQIVDPSTLSPFINRTDKNGKEIYVGDVIRVEYENADGEADVYYAEIIYDPKFCRYAIKFIFPAPCVIDEILSEEEFAQAQVIGNRWENPSLLTGNPSFCLSSEYCIHEEEKCTTCEFNPHAEVSDEDQDHRHEGGM